MKTFNGNVPLGPGAPVGEILLAETAIRIELPPSLHRLAAERFAAIRKYVERQGSPLFNRVRIFYPQGSMAIRATIKSRKREDGFDIDIVAELAFAWEFLRRNPAYRTAYLSIASVGETASETSERVAQQWGLRFRGRPESARGSRFHRVAAAPQSRHGDCRASPG